MTIMEITTALACIWVAFVWCLLRAAAKSEPSPPQVILQEDGKPLMIVGSEDPADAAPDGPAVLASPDIWDADGWWQDHREEVQAAVCRVGVDLRRGRYREVDRG